MQDTHPAPAQSKLPPVGQRIIKTSVAVLLCLLFYWLRGYKGSGMSAEAAITAIICLQPYIQDTKTFSFNRLAGTLIGAFWGLIFLLLTLAHPHLGDHPLMLYPLMGVGTLISLYTAVALRKPDTSSLAAIVFICVVIAFPDIEDPLHQAFHRMLDVLVGTVAAIGVNIFRLPRRKCRDRVFFVRTKDLSADQFSAIPPAVLFRLNSLYNEGARICLMSEHAPAFFMSQMSALRLSMPMIVMDGAAIYDTNENTYLSTTTIEPASSRWLMKRLNGLDIRYFIYTVRKDRNYIYHHGAYTAAERELYSTLRRSPYRNYLDGDHFELSDVVYFKVVAADDKARKTLRALQHSLAARRLRAVLRPQAGLPGGSSLYFYAVNADMPHAEARLMDLMHKKDHALTCEEVFSPTGYGSEHDAIHLLHDLGNRYEPLRLWNKRAKNSEKLPQKEGSA